MNGFQVVLAIIMAMELGVILYNWGELKKVDRYGDSSFISWIIYAILMAGAFGWIVW